MFTKEGIEVYLMRENENGEYQRIPEVEIQYGRNHDGWYKNCFVLYTGGSFEVVVRFPADYPMYEATAVHIGVAVAGTENFEMTSEKIPGRLRWRVLPRVLVAGQQYVTSMSFNMTTIDENEVTLLSEKNIHGVERYKNYNDSVPPGTVAVVIQRGNVEWKEDELSNMDLRRDFESSTFESSDGEAGRKSRSDFRPRSHERLTEAENMVLKRSEKPPLSHAQIADCSRYAMQPDNDFVHERSRTEEIRGKIRKEHVEQGRVPEVIANAPAMTPRSGKKWRRRPNMCVCPQESQAGTGQCNSTSEIHRVNLLGGNSMGHNEASPDRTKSNEVLLSLVNLPQRCLALDMDMGLETETGEFEAAVCQICHKKKPAGNGRKLAYRAGTGRWFSVPEDAPEDEPLNAAINDRGDEELRFHPASQLQSGHRIFGKEQTAAAAQSKEHTHQSTNPSSNAEAEVSKVRDSTMTVTKPNEQVVRQAGIETSPTIERQSISQAGTVSSRQDSAMSTQPTTPRDRQSTYHDPIPVEDSSDEEALMTTPQNAKSPVKGRADLEEMDDNALGRHLASLIRKREILELHEEIDKAEQEQEEREKKRVRTPAKSKVKSESRLDD